jgi:hypothetical protein
MADVKVPHGIFNGVPLSLEGVIGATQVEGDVFPSEEEEGNMV